MKSLSCSMYSFVRFEYSNSMATSPFGVKLQHEGGEGVYQIAREGCRVHLLDGALEPDRPVGTHLDAQGAARHPHGHEAVVTEAVLDGGARHRARRRAGGEGIAGAALPDEDVH